MLVISILISVFVVIYKPEFMVHGITWAHGDNFETGAPASFWVRAQADPYIVTRSPDSVKSGNYGANSTYGDQFYVWYYDLGGGTGTIWFSMEFKILGNLNYLGSGGWIFNFNCNDTVDDYGSYLYLVMGTGYALFEWQSDTGQWMDGSHITNNTWYFLKIKTTITGSAMNSTLYLDNVEDCNVTTSHAGLQYSTVSLTSAPGWYFQMAVDNYGQSGEEPSSSYGSPSLMDLTVNSYPSSLPVSFTYNGTFYDAPHDFTPTMGDIINLVALNDSYVSCKWVFEYWLLNMTTQIVSNSATINVTGDTTMTMWYSGYDPTFPGNYTTLNVDGNVSATSTLNHTYYWNPHSMNTVNGALVLADLNSWSIDFLEGYARLILDSNSTDAGHIAAGSWYSTWNTSDLFGVQARQPLANSTYMLSFDMRIVNVTYNPTSWLRIAMAVSWCDPTNNTGWAVKYVERDLYDNSIALNHSQGNAGHAGNLVFKGGDVIEYQYDMLPMNSWRHFDWNISQYIEAGWGNVSADARLESAYVVIEVENVTHSEVDVNNLWLRVANSSTAAESYFWDSRVSRSEGSQAEVRWVTAWRNGTDGYGLYADIRADEWYDTGTHLVFADDNQDAYWNVVTNGTSTLTADVDASFKMNGSDSLKITGKRGSSSDECYVRYPFLSASPLRAWSNYDFFVFFMYFNSSDLYFHRFQAIDNDSKTMEWEILDYFNNITTSGWSMVTLPIRRPSLGNCTAFNYANVSELRFWPDKAYENRTEAYNKDFTVWMDSEYLDKATMAYVTFNAPLNYAANITIYGKKEITGWDSQYLPIVSSTYIVNGTNYQLLRPNWIKNWAPANPFSTSSSDAVAVGYSEYERAFSGNLADVIGGESFSAVLVNGTAMGSYRKLVLRLKLAPVRPEYSLNNVDGDICQDYTFGDAGELKLMIYFQTDMSIDVGLTLDVEGCGNWVFVNERYYNWTLTVVHSISASMVNLTQMRFCVSTRQGLVFNTLTYDGTNWTVAYEPANITDYNIVPVRTQKGTAAYSGDLITVTFTFRVYFTQDCLDEYRNPWDVTGRLTDTDGHDTGWSMLMPRAFKIYNKGGFSMNATAGAVGPGSWSAGVNTARTPFSFWAENNSWASNDLYYRDLVHLKMQPSIVALLGRATFYVTYGVDYCIQGDSAEWVTGLKVILGAVAVTIGSERWWNWTVSWFFQGAFVRQDYVMAFERAGIYWVPYEDSSLVAETKLWIDIWFDNANGSTVVAGRVSSYEWPMENNAPELIRYLNSAWGPMDTQPTSSECFQPITASDNVTIEPSAKIKMIKYWSSVEVAVDDEDQLVYVLDFNVWDLTFSQTPFPPLSGIQTPVFQPPLFPDMPGGGFFGALFSGFSYIGKMLGDNALFGGLGLWTNFVGFLDTIAAWFGAPGAFTHFITWLSTELSFLWIGLSYVGSLFLNIFVFLASIMDYFIALLAQAVLTFANMIGMIANMLTGAYGTGANLWVSLGIWNWVVLGLICYPIYLFALWDAEGSDAVFNQLMFIFNIGNMLVHYLISFIQMVIGVIHTLVESIPVVE